MFYILHFAADVCTSY